MHTGMGGVGLCETYNEPACSACFGMSRRKTFGIPNAQVDGSQVVTIAAFDVNVLSSPGGEGVLENGYCQSYLFRHLPGL